MRPVSLETAMEMGTTPTDHQMGGTYNTLHQSWVKKLGNYQHGSLEKVLNIPHKQETAATISRQPSRSTRYHQNGQIHRCVRIAMGSLLCVAAATADQQLRPGEHQAVGLTEAL